MNAEVRATPLLVTGAAGWLGRALCAEVGQNHEKYAISRLVVMVRSQQEKEVLAGSFVSSNDFAVKYVLADITRPDEVATLFDNLDEPFDVIHTAGIIHPKKISDLYAVNETGTRTVMQLAHERGAARVVHVSSNSPFGNNPHPEDLFRNSEPFNPYMAYGDSKMRGEIAVQENVDRGLDAVIVRPPWFYGPFQPARQTTFFSMVKSGRFPVFGSGNQRRSMVYIDNLTDGIMRARNWSGPAGRAWWIADARPYRVDEIVSTVGRALTDEGFSVKKNSLRIPNLIGNLAEVADGLVQKTGRYVQPVHVLGEMNKTIACDISDATADLGYRPNVDLYEGMRRSIRWCAEQGIEL